MPTNEDEEDWPSMDMRPRTTAVPIGKPEDAEMPRMIYSS